MIIRRMVGSKNGNNSNTNTAIYDMTCLKMF